MEPTHTLIASQSVSHQSDAPHLLLALGLALGVVAAACASGSSTTSSSPTQRGTANRPTPSTTPSTTLPSPQVVANRQVAGIDLGDAAAVTDAFNGAGIAISPLCGCLNPVLKSKVGEDASCTTFQNYATLARSTVVSQQASCSASLSYQDFLAERLEAAIELSNCLDPQDDVPGFGCGPLGNALEQCVMAYADNVAAYSVSAAPTCMAEVPASGLNQLAAR